MPIPCPKKFKPRATDKMTWEKSVEVTAKLYPNEFRVWLANPEAKVSTRKQNVLESIMNYLDYEPTGISRMFNFNLLTTKKSYATCLEIFYKADLSDELFMLYVINQINNLPSPDQSMQKTLNLAETSLQNLMIPYQDEMKKAIAGLGIVVVATASSFLSLKSITYAGYGLIPVSIALGVALLLSNEFIKWRLQEALKERLTDANVIQAKIAEQDRHCQSSGTPLHRLDTSVQDAMKKLHEEHFALMASPIKDSWSKPIDLLTDVTDISNRLCVAGFSLVKTKLLMWEAKLHRNTQPPAYASLSIQAEEEKSEFQPARLAR